MSLGIQEIIVLAFYWTNHLWNSASITSSLWHLMLQLHFIPLLLNCIKLLPNICFNFAINKASWCSFSITKPKISLKISLAALSVKLRYLKSTLLLQIPRHITTVIHLLHISHFFIFLEQMAAAKNLKAKIRFTKFLRLMVYQISLSI